MKKLFTILIFALSLTTAQAQMADGSTAPDWTLTDINGNTHNLYNMLDSGYVVYLDFSATWCPPCWSYHQSHAFRDLYNNYGPGTADNKVRVFMVEGDASTNSADLAGTGSNTQGDWISGVPYPIIDDASITSLYQIGYWPTIYKVCPSKIITEIGQQSTADLWAAAQENNCQLATQSVDALVDTYEGTEFLCGTQDIEVSILNLGTTALTSADIKMMDGNNVISTTSWSGNLSTYGGEVVNLGPLSIAGTTNITFEVVAAGDANANNNTLTETLNVATVTTHDTITVQVQTDNYGNETYWAIVDDAGAIKAQGGNLFVGITGGGNGVPAGSSGYANNSLNEEVVVLPKGCYEFVIVDAYGDGICCSFGTGFYNVFAGVTSTTPQLLANGGSFGAGETIPYEAAFPVNTKEVIALNSVKVFPNPATTLVNIEFNLASTEDMEISISNALGQTVKNVNTGNLDAGVHNFSVNTSDLAAGMYFINFTDGQNVMTQRFVVAK